MSVLRAIGVVTIALAAFAACGGDAVTPGRSYADGRLRSSTGPTAAAPAIPTVAPTPTTSPVPTPAPTYTIRASPLPTPTLPTLPPRACCTPPPHHTPHPRR